MNGEHKVNFSRQDTAAPLKVLVVGDWRWPWYQEACAGALESLGHEVVRFGWSERFSRNGRGASLWLRLQMRTLAGPTIWQIRRDLVRLVAKELPDIGFFYNVQLIDAATVKTLRRLSPATLFCQYANDDPFALKRVAGLWRHFLRSVPCFDVHLAYRTRNLTDFAAHGARHVHLLRSYFIPADDCPLAPSERDPRFESDIVFAGHYEDDGRLPLLHAVAVAGYRVKLFGTGWDTALPASSPLRRDGPVRPVYGDDYRRAIGGAKGALCFLSARNRDTYTRRNFQIPAMRIAMITQASDELKSLFHEEQEALFFTTATGLIQKVGVVVGDASRRAAIAAAGYERVYRDGHDVIRRMAYFVETVTPYRAEKRARAGRTG